MHKLYTVFALFFFITSVNLFCFRSFFVNMWPSYKRLFNSINVNTFICIAHKSHYEALNISKTATHKEIKDAYYRLSMIYHPDKNKGSKEAADIFRDITSAYEILGNVRQRRLYDSGINPNKKFPQHSNNRQPFETMHKKSGVDKASARSRNYSFDEWSKAHYTNAFQTQYNIRMTVEQRKLNQKYASIQHNYSSMALMVCSTFTVLFFMFELLKKLKAERDRLLDNDTEYNIETNFKKR